MIRGMKSTSNGLSQPKERQRRVSLGDGLMRLERPGGTSSWVCRVQSDGVRRDFGLGSCQKVSLAQAREMAQEIRSQIEMGVDPQIERRKRQAVPTFKDAAVITYEIHSKTWRNGKHHAQWMRTMELTGISRSTLYLLIARGEIEIVKMGAATLVLTESLRELIERQRGTSISKTAVAIRCRGGQSGPRSVRSSA